MVSDYYYEAKRYSDFLSNVKNYMVSKDVP